jgi:glutaconyl-CoA/methylmalonyl-CoA decarboxylase subunit gamma
MKYFITLPDGVERTVDVTEDAKGMLRVSVGGVPHEVDVPRLGRGASSIRIGARSIELWLEDAPPDVGVIADGRRFFAKVESERMRIQAAGKPASGNDSVVRSPMPGRVVRVLCAEGAEIAEGAPVIVVEAMKMENELAAPRAGRVQKIHVAAGATVESGAVLIELEPIVAG